MRDTMADTTEIDPILTRAREALLTVGIVEVFEPRDAPELVVCFLGDTAEGWMGYAAVTRAGLMVSALRQVWRVRADGADGVPQGPHWELTFHRPPTDSGTGTLHMVVPAEVQAPLPVRGHEVVIRRHSDGRYLRCGPGAREGSGRYTWEFQVAHASRFTVAEAEAFGARCRKLGYPWPAVTLEPDPVDPVGPRYVLHPGYVQSRGDGQCHYIDAPTLRDLYRVPRHARCVTLRRQPHPMDRGWLDEPGDVHLYPRGDGLYEPVR